VLRANPDLIKAKHLNLEWQSPWFNLLIYRQKVLVELSVLIDTRPNVFTDGDKKHFNRVLHEIDCREQVQIIVAP
jgi:hypothetical protein